LGSKKDPFLFGIILNIQYSCSLI